MGKLRRTYTRGCSSRRQQRPLWRRPRAPRRRASASPTTPASTRTTAAPPTSATSRRPAAPRTGSRCSGIRSGPRRSSRTRSSTGSCRWRRRRGSASSSTSSRSARRRSPRRRALPRTSPPSWPSSRRPIRTCATSSSATSRTSRASSGRSSPAPDAVSRRAVYAGLLAKSYDALKEVDPGIRVIGLGLSGRGNDLPLAPSNASTSPVRFLRDLGAAYRASGRTLPLMDELGLHLYPRSDRDPVQRRRPLAARGDRQPRPDQAGVLGRVRRHGAADRRAGPEAPHRRDRLAGRRSRRRGAMRTTAARPQRPRASARRPTTTRS